MSEIKRVDGVYFRGNATDCIEGAWNEYKAAHEGLIVFAGIHAYFIPPTQNRLIRRKTLVENTMQMVI